MPAWTGRELRVAPLTDLFRSRLLCLAPTQARGLNTELWPWVHPRGLWAPCATLDKTPRPAGARKGVSCCLGNTRGITERQGCQVCGVHPISGLYLSLVLLSLGRLAVSWQRAPTATAARSPSLGVSRAPARSCVRGERPRPGSVAPPRSQLSQAPCMGGVGADGRLATFPAGSFWGSPCSVLSTRMMLLELCGFCF